MNERLALPPRQKEVRPNEWHLFCPGQGCSARLAIRRRYPDGPDPERWFYSLEPRYTDEPHEEYQKGTWWRRNTGGYKGLPSARRQRRVLARASLGEGDAPYEQQMRPYVNRRGNVRIPLPTPEDGWNPPPQQIVCYECDGHVVVDTSAVAN